MLDEQNAILVSAASAWEIATRNRLGKLPSAGSLVADIAGAIASEGFIDLPITVAHATRAGTLPGPHRDPFDRILIAQAMLEDLVLVSSDTALDGYAARRLW